ncbi:MAG: hypothetical protein KIS77_07980 [Saprospiraceae bacterium]|nr:hypothetical protein [Saprospiraceae bacterium]
MQSKSGIFGEKFNEASRKKGFPFAKGLHRNKSNIFLTPQGIRLIDVGISALRSQVGDKVFQKFVEAELAKLEHFKTYFLNR